ncbi:MAG: hypothetical protein F7C36_02085 [Desulfurococcales archaeon]|nr:hypothetical protein [Desulfurococcales archaeon]
MVLSKVYDVIREEAKYIVMISNDLALFIVSAIIVMLVQRRILLPVLDCAIYYAEVGKLWFTVFIFNLLTFLLLYYAFYIIYYKGSWVSSQRCKVIELPDCKLWNSLVESQRSRLLFGLFVSPIILLGLLFNSLRVIGYPIDFENVILVVNSGVSRLFGLFELGGYIVAIHAPAFDNKVWRIVLFVVGAIFLLIGAYIEAVFIFELHY